jgi:hypothetical protein
MSDPERRIFDFSEAKAKRENQSDSAEEQLNKFLEKFKSLLSTLIKHFEEDLDALQNGPESTEEYREPFISELKKHINGFCDYLLNEINYLRSVDAPVNSVISQEIFQLRDKIENARTTMLSEPTVEIALNETKKLLSQIDKEKASE